jgi:putative ABC transport system ATP-binding protein
LPILTLSNISLKSTDKLILDNVSLDIKASESLAIIGASGCGKSSLLRILANLTNPSAGTICYKQQNYAQINPSILRRKIGYCFQIPCLFGETVYDNLLFPFQVHAEKYNTKKTRQLFEQFELNPDLENSSITMLSGGEKQRIALIRSLLFLPEILLLDEITSALDHENTLIVERVLNDVNALGISLVWVTHSLEQSQRVASRVITMKDGAIISEHRGAGNASS